jgi:acetolactate synthase-1/3 small subunit
MLQESYIFKSHLDLYFYCQHGKLLTVVELISPPVSVNKGFVHGIISGCRLGGEMKEERHILTMLVENEPGVTARVSGLFASRGYNIETICGAPTANPKMSRITISTQANPEMLEQIMKQVRRLVNIIKVRDMTGEEAVKREMALICVKARPKDRTEILRIVETFRGRIVDTGLTHFIIEATGGQQKIDALIRLLEPMGIKKLARSGILALYREPE